jgi:hypothetical protein
MANQNYYQRQNDQQPNGFLVRGNTENDPPVRGKTPAPTGDEPTADQPQNYGGNTEPTQPAAPGPAANVDVTAPDVTQQVSDMIASGNLQRSPYYPQILANQQKLIALRAQPTYVNKKGETVRGMKDQNGRLQSGLRALVERLAHMGPTPDWGSFAAGLAGGAGAGVAGAIVPEWDEWSDRNREIQRLEEETQNMIKGAQAVSSLQSQEVNRQDKVIDNKRADQVFEQRVNENKLKNLREDKKALLTPIFQRGRYVQGENPQEDEALAKAGVILGDFDKTKKPVKVNGQWYEPIPGKPDEMRPVDGLPVDPDDEPITFMADGEKITASRKNYLSYKAPIVASQVAAQNKTAENDNKYQLDVAEIKGKIAAEDTAITSATKRLDEIGKLTGLEKIKAADEREKLEKELREARSNKAGFEARMNAMPKPPAVVGRTGGGAIPSVDEATFRKRLAVNGITDEAKQNELIAKARAEGIIK